MKKLIVLGLVLFTVGILWFLSDFHEWTDPSFSHGNNQVMEQNGSGETVAENGNYPEEVDFVAVERFFYHQLDESEREIYRVLRDGVAQGELTIHVDSGDFEKVQDIFQRVMWDHPEFFWLTGSAETTITNWPDGRSYMSFQPGYGHTGDEKIAMQAIIDERIETFLATVDNGLSEFELVLAVYE